MTQHKRLTLLRKILTDEQSPLRIRVTACLVLLYAQPVSKIVRLTVEDIIRDGADVLLRLGANGNVRAAQRFAGHARPETTMRYDRARRGLSDHGAYNLAGRFGTRTRPAPP